MTDRNEIRRLTQSYRYLRGYEQLPFALFWLGYVASHVMGWQRPGELGSDLGMLVGLLVAFAATVPIKRYYDRRFGIVKTPSGAGCAFWVVGGIAFVALQGVSRTLDLNVELGFVAAGIALALYALRRFKLEGHRLVFAVFLLIISVWPPVSDPPRGAEEPWYAVFGFGSAALLIAMGFWDHHTLVRAFERAHVDQPVEPT